MSETLFSISFPQLWNYITSFSAPNGQCWFTYASDLKRIMKRKSILALAMTINKSKVHHMQETIRSVVPMLWRVEVTFWDDLLCSPSLCLSMGLLVCNQWQQQGSASSAQAPAATTELLYLMLFFINLNTQIVLFCWYQAFHGKEVCNAMQAGKLLGKKLSICLSINFVIRKMNTTLLNLTLTKTKCPRDACHTALWQWGEDKENIPEGKEIERLLCLSANGSHWKVYSMPFCVPVNRVSVARGIPLPSTENDDIFKHVICIGLDMQEQNMLFPMVNQHICKYQYLWIWVKSWVRKYRASSEMPQKNQIILLSQCP